MLHIRNPKLLNKNIIHRQYYVGHMDQLYLDICLSLLFLALKIE